LPSFCCQPHRFCFYTTVYALNVTTTTPNIFTYLYGQPISNSEAPFLTLFLVGIIKKSNPDLLAMGESMENLIASWPGLIFLGIMTVLEFVAKCVPVFDEAMDSVMLFIIPFMSVLGTLSTFGLYSFSMILAAEYRIKHHWWDKRQKESSQQKQQNEYSVMI
jgi:hypothetical protein